MDIRKTLRSKFFWVSTTISITLSLMTVYGQQNPEFWYLSIPLGLLVIGVIPAISAHVLSVRTALFLIYTHRNLVNFSNRNNISYILKESQFESPSYRNFALYNLWYASGITFLLLRFSDIELSNINQLVPLTMSGVLLSIVFASGLNFAIFLIQKKRVFFENKKDGSLINLGSDLRRIINYGLGPLQIIFFVYLVVMESDILLFAIAIGVALLFCGCGSITSYFILKKHYVNRIYEKFDKRLQL